LILQAAESQTCEGKRELTQLRAVVVLSLRPHYPAAEMVAS